MTGQYADFGKAMTGGARWAVRNINTRGEIRGRKVRFIVEDDACDRLMAIEVAKRLVSQGVATVIGHYCASASIAAAPIYAAAGMIMISPGTTDPALTDKRAGPTIFRLAPRKDAEGPAIGTYIARHFSGKRVAILHDRTVPTMALATAAKRAMNAAGFSEVLYSGFAAGEKDYARLARDLHLRQVEAVFLGAYPTEAALILRALRAEQSPAVIVGTSLMANSDFNVLARSDLDRRVMVPAVTPLDLQDHLPRAAHLAHSLPPESLRATWRAIEVWEQASRSNESALVGLTEKVFKNELDGEFRFDKNGDATLDFFKMYTWKDGDNVVPVP